MSVTDLHLYPHVPHHFEAEGLLGMRPAVPYNLAEQRYSAFLHRRFEELLRGRRNRLPLLRKYPNDPHRLGILPTPRDVDRRQLRIPIVEKMTLDALVCLTEHSPGGPIAQEVDTDGGLVERRYFPSKWPHIVVSRVDTYLHPHSAPDSVQWLAYRVQNQRASTQINRMLDAANLGLELLRFVR